MDLVVLQSSTGLPLLHDQLQELELARGVSVQLISQDELDDGGVQQLVLSDQHQLLNAVTLPDGTQAFVAQESVFIETKSQENTKEYIQLDHGAILIKDISDVSSNSNVDLPNEEAAENDVSFLSQEQNVQLQVIDGVLYLVRNEAEDCQSLIELTETLPKSDSIFSTDNQNDERDERDERDDRPKSESECPGDDRTKVYRSDHLLKEHEQNLTSQRPFVCTHPKCKKNFTAAYSLKAHLRTHTGEKPYKCTMGDCDKKFKTSGDLLKHVRTHTGERPFVCPFDGCGRSFTTSNIRKVHVRTHTGERPFKCQQPKCGKAFASSTNYKNHIRIHSGEKPYVCSIKNCGRRFTEYSSLYKHHLVHTQEKPYVCELCKKQYRQQSTLLMHKKTAHSVIENDPDSVLDVLLENSVDIMDQANELVYVENGEIDISDFDIEDETRILLVDDASKLITSESQESLNNEAEENPLDMALKELNMNYGDAEFRWN